MRNKYKIVITLITSVFALSCVSPFYGTARIEEGWHMDVGAGAASFITAEGDLSSYCIGGRADIQLKHGFNQYFLADARLGIGGGIDTDNKEQHEADPVLFDPAIGLQAALPMGWFTPAVRTEFTATLFWGPQLVVSPVLLLGFGEPEFITIGGRARIGEWKFFDTFAVLHLTDRWSIFTGVDITSIVDDQYPFLGTIGIGYKLK